MTVKKFKNLYSWLGFIILAMILITLVMISNMVLRNQRIDLTDHKLFSLSQGTKNIVQALEEPVTIRFFVSQSLITTIPVLQTYNLRIESLLQQYAARNDYIHLQIIDPEPFSEEEDLADNLGIRAIPLNQAGDKIYFGITVTNAVDEQKVFAFLDPKREAFFEYELTQAIYQLSAPTKPKIGIMSWIPLQNQLNHHQMSLDMNEDKLFYQQIKQEFAVKEFPLDLQVDPHTTAQNDHTKQQAENIVNPKEMADELGVLLIIHPMNISAETEYAIDQYLLHGGKAIIFVDPNAEIFNRPDASGTHKGFATSSLDKLFQAWGLSYDRKKIIADRSLAIRVSSGADLHRSRLDTVANITWLGITPEHMNQQDVITRELGLVRFISGGSLDITPESTLQFTPILQSSRDSKALPFVDLAALQMIGSGTASLLQNFVADNKEYTLAARLSGTLKSAFPEKQEQAGHVPASLQDTNLIIIADTDMLEDQVWNATRNFLGEIMHIKTADNGAMISNAIDQLVGNADLISLRSRNVAAKPFTKVNQIKNQAEQQYRQKEIQLQQKLEQTEQKIEQLQLSRNQQNQDQFLTTEQQQTIQEFFAEKTRIRKQLREVQHSLNKDIEALGNWLKLINIICIPLLLLIFALLRQNLFLRRHKEKNRRQ